MGSFTDKSDNYKTFKGVQPAADYVGAEVREQIFGSEVPGLVDFLQARIAHESVLKARDLASEVGVSCGAPCDGPYFVSDRDMGFGASTDDSSYALVKPGKKGAPLRIILAHTDSPCLRLTPQPVFIESDADLCLAYPSFSLMTRPSGAIRVDDWLGMDVDIIGRAYGEKTRHIDIPGRIKHRSFHVDSGEETRRPFELKIDSGVRKLGRLYELFGMKDGMDFACAKLYAVPHFPGTNGRLVGNELGAYGLDDRASLWAATSAGLESLSLEESDNTWIVLGLDKEETGSTGANGGYPGFCESVIKETLEVVYGDEAKNFDIPLDLRRRFLGNMPVISADCDVALGDAELQQTGDSLDFFNSAKTGWGPFISSEGPEWNDREVSPEHVARLASLFSNGLGGKKPRDRFHMIGKGTAYDSEFATGTMADVFDRFFPCVDVGLPITGLHSPRGEAVNVYDVHWLKEMLGLYLDSE
ncbi:hypothetical protein HOA55_04175 [archaeon]|jgi:aspartyl aminopeptidase|nr:hypothetical protein [archaeon]MBT3577922.1 hypothetical protein [archaeon]MBT6820525.1 hypothetical protein [archaeon]MBT6956623.1 hypothetical protein [archaeon]MBT7025775.1 hypothetical protein [archaeon]